MSEVAILQDKAIGSLPPYSALLAAQFGIVGQQEIIAKLLSKKGQFASISYRRPLKLLKTYVNEGRVGEKLVSLTVRCGVDYSNLQSTIEKVESGQISGNSSLVSREWVLFPYLLKSLTTGKLLFRFYPVGNSKVHTRYFLDGAEIPEESVPTYCLKSEWSGKDSQPCFDLPIESIISVK